jgi:hypothetical protein
VQEDPISSCRHQVAQALAGLGDDCHPNPNLEALIQRAKGRRPPVIARLVAEDARDWWVRAAGAILRDSERFQHLKGLINQLDPLAMQARADRAAEDTELVKAARARDHLRVWRTLCLGLNDRELKHALLPSDWWPKRDAAIRAVERALLTVCRVLNESSADPGLLGLSFEPVMRAFHEFKNPKPEAFEGRGHVLRVLVVGTPRGLGWSKGGRFLASWLRRTAAELRQWGVRGESVTDLLDAAGLTGTSPTDAPKSSRKRPTARQKRR